VGWFAVRHVFRNGSNYEERVTLWERASFAAAMTAAEDEAKAYSDFFDDAELLGLFQAFELADPPGEGRECWSLIRGSDLDPEEYLATFFDTGREIMGKLVEDDRAQTETSGGRQDERLVVAGEIETYGVRLVSGEVVVVNAHDTEIRDDIWLFMLHSVVPVREHVIARFPIDIVESVVGGYRA